MNPPSRPLPPLSPAAPRPRPAPPLAPLPAARAAGRPAAETFYGFSEPPFSQSSDPKFLYHSSSHGRVMQELLTAIRRHDSMVVLTGDVGCGKTMVCRAVLEQLDRRTLTSFVSDPFVNIEELLRTVLADFGVVSRDDLASGRLAGATRRDLARTLRGFVVSLQALQARAVVLIDDAHGVPIDVLDQLRVLSDLDGDRPLVEIVLVGRPDLLETLARRELQALRQRVTVRCEVEPIGGDEIAGYVTHRLAVAGVRVEFADAALAAVYELSNGVPRTINLLCDRALTLGSGCSAAIVDEPLILRAAEQLELAPPGAAASLLDSWVPVIAVVLIVVALVTAGAAAAAVVYRDRMTQMIVNWERIPVPPPAPVLPASAPLPVAVPPL